MCGPVDKQSTYLHLQTQPFSSVIYMKTPTRNLPFGDKVTAGMECIEGSAMYLKSTGTSLKIDKINIDGLKQEMI